MELCPSSSICKYFSEGISKRENWLQVEQVARFLPRVEGPPPVQLCRGVRLSSGLEAEESHPPPPHSGHTHGKDGELAIGGRRNKHQAG